MERIREAIELYVSTLVEDGLPIPTEDILIKPIEMACVTPKLPATTAKDLVRVTEKRSVSSSGVRAVVTPFTFGPPIRLAL